MLDALLERVRSTEDGDAELLGLLAHSRPLRLEVFERALRNGLDDDPMVAELLCGELSRLDDSEEDVADLKEALGAAGSLRWAGLCAETAALALTGHPDGPGMIATFGERLGEMDEVQANLVVCLVTFSLGAPLLPRVGEAVSVLLGQRAEAPGEAVAAEPLDAEVLRGLLDGLQVAYRDVSATHWQLTLRYHDAFDQKMSLSADLGLTGRSLVLRTEDLDGNDADLMAYNHTAGLARFGRSFAGAVTLTAEIDRNGFSAQVFERLLADFVLGIEYCAGRQRS
jgi:hypothetical protein